MTLELKRQWIAHLLVVLFFISWCYYIYCYSSSKQFSDKFTPPPPKATNKSTVRKGNRNEILVLIWFPIFRRHHKLDSCRALFDINDCLITTDRSMYSKAHGVLINHGDIRGNLSKLPLTERPYFQKWVWMNFESPTNSRKIPGIDNLFNLTMNYRRDADISVHERLIQTQKDEPFEIPKKSLLVCWIVSHWNPTLERVKFYNLLKEHIKINVFGRPFKRLTNEEYVSTVSSCKFYLSFENSEHKDYITEKLYKPLNLGAVPVVLGPPREQYENIVPGDAFIHVDDFSSPKELAGHLKFLDENDEKYQHYFEWKKRFRVKSVNFPMEHVCRTCDYLKRHSQEYQTFHNLTAWYWG